MTTIRVGAGVVVRSGLVARRRSSATAQVSVSMSLAAI
jgi:hypothetical protein